MKNEQVSILTHRMRREFQSEKLSDLFLNGIIWNVAFNVLVIRQAQKKPISRVPFQAPNMRVKH